MKTKAPFPSRACRFPPLVSPPRTLILLGKPGITKFASQPTTKSQIHRNKHTCIPYPHHYRYLLPFPRPSSRFPVFNHSSLSLLRCLIQLFQNGTCSLSSPTFNHLHAVPEPYDGSFHSVLIRGHGEEGIEGEDAAAKPLREGHWNLHVAVDFFIVVIVDCAGLGEEVFESHHLVVRSLLLAFAAVAGHDLPPHIIDGLGGGGDGSVGDGDEVGGGELRRGRRRGGL